MGTVPDNVITQKNYNGIDLAKFICAILIFIIHIPPFFGKTQGWQEQVNFGLQHCFSRVAVPFYFVCSGFFLFNKMSLDHLDVNKLKEYCFKLLKLAGIWYFLQIVGLKEHLWYLGATVVAIIVISLFLRWHIRFCYICLIAAALYVIGLLGDAYYGVISPLTNIPLVNYLFKAYTFAFTSTKNGVFMGTIFVLMGVAFAKYKIKVSTWIALPGLLVSLLLLFLEAFTLKHYSIQAEYNMYLSLVPAVYFLFCFVSSLTLRDRPIYKHLRNMGMIIYFTHILLKELVWIVIYGAEKFLHIPLTSHLFIITLAVTILVAAFAEWLSCKEKFKWIRWVIS